MQSYDGVEMPRENSRRGPVTRQRSLRINQLPIRPSTSSDETPRSTPMSYNSYASRDNRQAHSPYQDNYRRPSTAQRSISNERHRVHSNNSSHSRSPHPRPSEASRLRVLQLGSTQSATGRHTPDHTAPDVIMKSQQRIDRRSEESLRPSVSSASTFPLQNKDEQRLPYSLAASRERGLSSASSRSYPIQPSISLRPSTSIPDFGAADPGPTRQRNFSNISGFRAERTLADNNISSTRREGFPKATGVDDEEVRASFRSALTATSSFLGTSGTERSSVLTKSSSATSIFGRDEGMSVDDAIGMYESGFADSGAEETYPSRPGTSQSHRSARSRLGQPDNDFLPLPLPNKIIRDSAAIFQVTTPASLDRAQSPKQTESSSQLQAKRSVRDGEGVGLQGSLNFDDTRDRYGFRKKSQHISQATYDNWNAPYEEYIARRRKKWVALMKESGLATDNPVSFPTKSAKVKRFIRKGIPPDWRGAAWFWYAGGPTILAKNAGVYDDLIRKAENGRVDPNDHEIIERDLNRTFPDNIRFKPDPSNLPGVMETDHNGQRAEPETPILQALRRVLQAFSILNPKIGYCQSLNFLAGLLLLFMEEEKAFWMLNIITRVYLPGTHEVNLEGANVDLGVLMTSIKDSMPAIWAKIGGELDGSAGDGRVSMHLPPITLCCTAWFMSCFIGTLPIETTLRVWDSFFYEGSKTVFRIALAIFKVGEAEIRAVSDPMEIFQVVQTIPRRLIDASALMEACFKRRNGFGHLSQATIEARRKERRDGYADERAKAAGERPLSRKHTLFSRHRGKSRGAG